MYIKRINNGNLYDGLYYFKNSECTILHREDGPAIESVDGHKEWRINGKYHREDGPAIIYVNGEKSYYLNNNWLTKQQYIEYIKSKPICPKKKSRILKQCT